MTAPPASILDLIQGSQVSFEPLDPRGHPWLLKSDETTAVLRRTTASVDHVRWLHRFLSHLALTGFPAPKPLGILGGASVAEIDGTVWETLSFLPGRPFGWDPAIPLESAGALLARYHDAAFAVPVERQRPHALPMEACRPQSQPQLTERFLSDLVELGHDAAERCVVHGDCTTANILVDEQKQAASSIIDFTLAHVGPPEADVAFALWVNGRTRQPDTTLNAARIRAFVAGYQAVRPLGEWAVRAVPLYLVGRGLQMLLRLERAGRQDEIQVTRLKWLSEHRPWLEDVVASARDLPHHPFGP